MIVLGLLATLATPLATPPPCRPYVAGAALAQGTRQGEAMAAVWPLEWRRRGTIRHVDVPPAALQRTVAALACTASWPGEEARAIALALPLFGSKRHGPMAFMMLDGMARSSAAPGPVRAAAAAFRARMRHAVAQRYDII